MHDNCSVLHVQRVTFASMHAASLICAACDTYDLHVLCTWWKAVHVLRTWWKAVHVLRTWWKAVYVLRTWWKAVHVLRTWWKAVHVLCTWWKAVYVWILRGGVCDVYNVHQQ